MDLNKPLRVIWLINGIVVLLAILYTAGDFLIDYLSRPDNSPPEVIVGEKLTDAKKKGLALQGLKVDEAFRVQGSSGYLVPVGIKTYKEPREMKEVVFENFAYDHTMQIYPDDLMLTSYNCINLIFTDDQFVVRRKLLDRLAYVSWFTYQREGHFSETKKNPIPYIGYILSFTDTNNDGAINGEDESDLYLSGLQGENLIQVTKGIDIEDFRFLNANQVFIQYNKKKEEREEYQRPSFMLYQIDTKNLDELNSLNETLDAIESGLSK